MKYLNIFGKKMYEAFPEIKATPIYFEKKKQIINK